MDTHVYDFTDDEAKQLSREDNLKQVMRCPNLYDRHNNLLLCDWAELPGEQAPTFQMLEERGLLRKAKFLGAERSETVYDRLCARFGMAGPQHQFFHEWLHIWLRGAPAEHVGVLNWDSLHLSKDTPKFRARLREIWEFAQDQQQRIGNFALILNAGLQRGGSVEALQTVLLEEVGYKLDESHLERPGVLYGGDREGRNAGRINYPILFGPTVPEESKERR